MLYYYKNIELLKLNNHNLYIELINTNLEDYKKLDKIEMVETKDGTSSISIDVNLHSYRLNSTYYPLKEAKKWVDQFNIKNINTVISMFGFGNGIFVQEMVQHLKESDFMLIYEPSAELFNFVLNHYDLTDILSSSQVLIYVEGLNGSNYKNAVSNFVNWYNLNSHVICTHPQYNLAFPESYHLFHDIILDHNNFIVVNQNTSAALSKLMTNNSINNLKFLRECNIVTDFIGKISPEIPAIIVAAGPSLDKNIEFLSNAKGKSVIFAVDTAVKYLLKRNIEPDFIVTLDPKKSLHHLSDSRCSRIPLFTRIEARPQNLEKNNKKLILYNIEGYSNRLLQFIGKDTGTLYSGGSVATGAFSVCKTIGFKTIILIGLDLAYSGNSTHAGGINVDVSGAGRYMEQVEDIYGNTISTRYDWFAYLKWFEEAIESLPGSEVIDATEGGAKVKGTIIMNLKEAIERYCIHPYDINKIIEELEPTVNSHDFLKIYSCIQNDIKDLIDMRDKAKIGFESCMLLMNKYNESLLETRESIKENDKLTSINNDIEKREIYQLIDWDISEDTFSYMSNLYTYSGDEKENKLYTYQRAADIYNAIIKSIDRIIPLLESASRNFI